MKKATTLRRQVKLVAKQKSRARFKTELHQFYSGDEFEFDTYRVAVSWNVSGFHHSCRRKNAG